MTTKRQRHGQAARWQVSLRTRDRHRLSQTCVCSIRPLTPRGRVRTHMTPRELVQASPQTNDSRRTCVVHGRTHNMPLSRTTHEKTPTQSHNHMEHPSQCHAARPDACTSRQWAQCALTSPKQPIRSLTHAFANMGKDRANPTEHVVATHVRSTWRQLPGDFFHTKRRTGERVKLSEAASGTRSQTSSAMTSPASTPLKVQPTSPRSCMSELHGDVRNTSDGSEESTKHPPSKSGV